MKHRTRILLIVCGMALVSACGMGGKKEVDEDVGRKKYEVEKNPVDTIVLRKRDFNNQMLSNGRLRALRKSSLRFSGTGVVVKLNVKNGDWVTRGDVLAVLDRRDAELRLQQARYQMEKAKIELRDKLLGYGYKEADSLRVPEETMRIARIHSGYDDAELGLKGAEMAVENCTLAAPADGRVANLSTKLYEYPSEGEFCQVIDDRVFEVEFAVLETELGNLRIGQRTVVSSFTDPEKTYAGKVMEINPTVDEKGQITVRAQLENPGHLIDGMNVKVFVENVVRDRFVVPKSAVLVRDNQEVLFRMDDKGSALWTYVFVVMANSTSYVVVPNTDKGAELNEGDVVIVSGNLNLAHGSGVAVRQE